MEFSLNKNNYLKSETEKGKAKKYILCFAFPIIILRN